MKQSKHQEKSKKLTNNNPASSAEPLVRSLRLCEKFFFSILFLVVTIGLSAQSAAQEMETILGTQAVTYAQITRFTLEAANVMTTNNREEAFNYALERNWLPGNIVSSDLVRLDQVSLLLMNAFDLKGGLFYTITGNRHYAYRELVYQQVIQHRAQPAMNVSGEQFLFYINRLLAMQEIRDLALAAARRRALAAEIAAIIVDQSIIDTTVRATDEGVMITLSNIMFQADSAVLPNSERQKLQEIGRILSSIPNVRILIAGHTTSVGTQEYLLTLSRARAQSVADYLVSLGSVQRINVTIAGYGFERPVADDSTPAGQAANRRVEIIILER